MKRLVHSLIILGLLAWGGVGWWNTHRARQAGAAFHESLVDAWGPHGCPPPGTRTKMFDAAAGMRDGDFHAVITTLGAQGPLTPERQKAAGQFFAKALDEQKRFLAVVEAARNEQRDGADTGPVQAALSDAMVAAANGDAAAVRAQIDLAEKAFDQIGMGTSSAGTGDTASEVAALVGRVGPAYNLGRDLMTEGHAASEKLLARASREFQAGQFTQAASMVRLAAELLGVEAAAPTTAVMPKWFDQLAQADPATATEAQALAVVNLAEAMAMSETPSKPVGILIDKARREFDLGRSANAYWWGTVALNALGMTDDAVAVIARSNEEEPSTEEPSTEESSSSEAPADAA